MTRPRLDDFVACIRAPRRRFVRIHARRQGFGLLELTVSLVIGGTAVAAAAALLVALSTRADAINDAALAIDRDANGERLLRLLTRGVDAMTDSTVLRGDSRHMTLRTWCETELGWSEPCHVQLIFRADSGTRELVVERLDQVERGEAPVHAPPSQPRPAGGRSADAQRVTVLRSGLRSGRFIYLVEASDGGTWTGAWSRITLPGAVAAVLDGDTLILPL